MDKHTVPLNKKICDQIGPELYKQLTDLGVTHVLNVPSFTRERKYAPCIGTIFVASSGGSIDYLLDDGTGVYLLNGTLQWVTPPDGDPEQAYGYHKESAKYSDIWHKSSST